MYHEINFSLQEFNQKLSSAKLIQTNPSFVCHKSRDLVDIVSKQANELQNNTSSKAMKAINECIEVDQINLDEVHAFVVATNSKV